MGQTNPSDIITIYMRSRNNALRQYENLYEKIRYYNKAYSTPSTNEILMYIVIGILPFL